MMAGSYWISGPDVFRAMEGGNGEASEKPHKRGASRFMRTPRSQSWRLPGPLELHGMEGIRKRAPIQTVGCTIVSGQEATTEILVYRMKGPYHKWHR
jgi:hypothetical protein